MNWAKIKDKIIEILERENPGLLPDEAEREADMIIGKASIYETAKNELLAEELKSPTG